MSTGKVGVIRKIDPSLLEPSFMPVWGAYAAMAGKPVARAGAKGLAAIGSAAKATTGVAAKMGQIGIRGLASSLGPAAKLRKPRLKVGNWDQQGKKVTSDDERAIDYDPAMQLVNDRKYEPPAVGGPGQYGDETRTGAFATPQYGRLEKDLQGRAALAAKTGDDNVLKPNNASNNMSPVERERLNQRIMARLKLQARKRGLRQTEGEIDDPNDPNLFLSEPMDLTFRMLKELYECEKCRQTFNRYSDYNSHTCGDTTERWP